GGIALGAYLFFFSSGGARPISQAVPRDCELLVELPSARKLVLDFHDVQFLDTSLRDDKKVFDSTADSVAKAFDISQSDATSLLVSVETSGIAARKLETIPEAVIAFGMRDGAPVEALLKSSRFVAAGAVGKSGRRYLLTRKQLQPGVAQDIVLKTLAQAEIGAAQKEQLVWFPSQKVLALGSAQLLVDLAQVLESGAASIEQNPAYQAAKKDFEPGARMTAFVDPGALSNVTDPKVKQLVSEYFTPAGPLTSSFCVKSAGFVNSFVGHTSGSKLPHDAAYEAPQALSLPDQLQAETFAYVAMSTRSKLSGADTEKLVFDQIGSIEPRSKAQAEQAVREMEQALGVSTAKLLDGIGGQAVLGMAATSDTRLDQLGKGPAAAEHFNVTYVQELKDDTEFKKLAAGLKQKILPSAAREVTITQDGAGFTLAPKNPPLPLSLRVKFLDKHLFITAGANALCDRAEIAFSKGTGALKDDAAHKASLAALPNTAHLRLWLDTGRILDTLEKTPQVKARLVEAGIPLDKVTLSGPNRVVSAFSARGEVQTEIWTFRVDALNLQALAPLGAGAEALAGIPALQQAF
ncbi:MAG TPA: hypothetical protein VGM44_08850, partial [Polyangiaceae bacterium]